MSGTETNLDHYEKRKWMYLHFHTEKTTYFKTKIPKETTSFSLTWMYVTGAPIFVLENKILPEKYIVNKFRIWTEKITEIIGVSGLDLLLFGSPDSLLFVRFGILPSTLEGVYCLQNKNLSNVVHEKICF